VVKQKISENQNEIKLKTNQGTNLAQEFDIEPFHFFCSSDLVFPSA
jgi:hypothetical protein